MGMTCTTCDHKAAHGWWGDATISHCSVCHVTWRGNAAAHCTGCHNHFTSNSAAKRHRCDIDPGDMVSRETQQPVFTPSDRGWRLAGNGYWTEAARV